MSIYDQNGSATGSSTALPVAQSLWSRYPKSVLHHQRRLLRLSAANADDAPATAEIELPLELAQGVDAFVRTRAIDFDELLLAAYHVLVQTLSGEVESLLACVRPSEDAAEGAVSASYVYAEAEEGFDGVLAQVNESLSGVPVAIDVALDPARESPAFFYQRGGSANAALPVVVSMERNDTDITLAVHIAPSVREFPEPRSFLDALVQLLEQVVVNPALTLGELQASVQSLAAVMALSAEKVHACQQQVIAIWAELLQVVPAAIQPRTSYFELGGTSLNAFKLVIQVRARFGVELNIRDIIEYHTLEAFTRLLLMRQAALAGAGHDG